MTRLRRILDRWTRWTRSIDLGPCHGAGCWCGRPDGPADVILVTDVGLFVSPDVMGDVIIPAMIADLWARDAT